MEPCDDKKYYIITSKCTSYSRSPINAGHICNISVGLYMSKHQGTKEIKELPVTCMGRKEHLKTSDLCSVSTKEAELLQAVEDVSERLKLFKEKKALLTAVGLIKDTPVMVEVGGEWLRGTIRYIGRITEPKYTDAIAGAFFGIEMQGEDKDKAQADGTHMLRPYLCEKTCDVFVPFSRVRPVDPMPQASPPPPTEPPLEPLVTGDRVAFFMNDEEHVRHGMVMNLEDWQGVQHVLISTDIDENGEEGGMVRIPIDCVIKEELFPESDRVDDMDLPEAPMEEVHPGSLGVSSMVEVTLGAGRTAFGIIRWTGTLPGGDMTMAGLELEESLGVSDGTFKGQRLFSCPPRRGLFVKLLSCRPDSRFQGEEANHSEKASANERETRRGPRALANVGPISSEQVKHILIGQMKGIQGHCNSCYMDSALFSLFSCTSVLDSLLFKSTEKQDAPIQNTLLHDIVNPLRSTGFVEGSHIMKLRQQLRDRGYSHSYTTEEKDPEEFLTLIMHHILCLEPLLKLSVGGQGEIQESYCYQIFLDHNHSLVLPTVQQLLEHSFHSAALRLAQVPSCLILQMPRFGKKFKMFEKIIPSLELDITDLLSEGPQQCVMCGQLACEECGDCFNDQVFSRTGFKMFCKTCSVQVHSHPQRMSHQRCPLPVPESFSGQAGVRLLPRETLELFAVLCIETSHYVSFVKHGPNKHDWIFFDSMADRQGDTKGFNIPQVQACPEVADYLDMSLMELANQIPRDMKGVAKRLFCDAYMYLYQSPSMSLYC